MPIQFPEPPPAVAAEAQPRRRPLARLRARAGPPPAVAPLPAQPVFTVGLQDLVDSADVERSITGPVHWRVSGFTAAGRPHVKEVAEDPSGAGVASGDDRFSPLIREALAVAADDPRVGEGSYEARLFRVPAVSLLALWLHGTARNLFVVLGRSPTTELEANRVYDEDAFMSAVRRAAERTLGAYRDAERPDELGS